MRKFLSGRVAAMAIAWTVVVDAGAFPHVAKPGDTPARLAERFYGRIELERVLVAANHLDEGRAGTLAPGMRLEIPAAGYHKVAPGETWPSMAAMHLGLSRRGEVLARINGANGWETPAVGREIVVPYTLRYVASQGDTLDTLAYRFIGKRDSAWMIHSYNELERPVLTQGQVLLIPITDLGLTEAGKTAAREAQLLTHGEAGGRARERQEAADRELGALAGKIRNGAWIEAIALGASLVGQGDLTEAQLAATHAALTEAYVAVGSRGLAADACARWRKHDPVLDLDPNRYSPKILAACTDRAAVPPADSGAR